MEYTELSAYDVPAGVVTTWTPCADPAQWRADDRGISPNHAQHLASGETGSWIGSIMRVPAPLVADTLARALRAWLARHEALRSDVVPADQGWSRRLLASEDVAIEHTVLGDHTGTQAQEALAELFATVSPRTWPHCVFATIATPGEESFTLAFGADHSVMDAYSQLLWFDEIAHLYRRASEGASDEELAATGSASHVDHAHAERIHADGLTADAEPVRRWREFLTAEGETAFPSFPVREGERLRLRVPHQRRELRQASFATWLADADRADMLNQLCKAGGASLQSGVFAAMGHVLREQQGVERLRFVVPMHTRFSLEHATAIGWYVGLCPLDLDLAGHPDLGDLLGHVHARFAQARDLVPHPVARVTELLEVSEGPKFAVSYVDGRFVPGAASWDEWRARALRSPAYADDEVYLWFGRTAEGLNVSARYPETVAAERAMRDLVAGIGDLIDEVTTPLLEGAVTA